MRKFYLHRVEDETGTSGTGLVAEGVEFDNGQCAVCWRTVTDSIGIYPSIGQVEKIHGHGGKTKIVMEPDDAFGDTTKKKFIKETVDELLECEMCPRASADIEGISSYTQGAYPDSYLKKRSFRLRQIAAAMGGATSAN